MKKNLLLLLIVLSMSSNAQIIIKSNLLMPIINRADISVAYELGEHYELELIGGFAYGKKLHYALDTFYPEQKGSFYRLEAKYFVYPSHEGLFFGSYIRKSDFSCKNPEPHLRDFYSNVVALGGIGGLKYNISPKLVMEGTLGLGFFLKYDKQRYIYDENIKPPQQYKRDIVLKLAFGYRFK